ncbi:hypothetical protein Tco_1382300 [Tanacetum coccineum]
MSSDSASSEEPESPEAAPASPNYVSGPEEPEQTPPSPDYVPGPEYPEYLAPADDEIVAEDQPYADYASPAALSPGYVADSDPKEDSEDVPIDYPADGGDDDDDDSSDDDDEEEVALEEEEHLALAGSVITPAIDPVPSSKETEPFKTDESAATPPPPPPLGARISIRPQAPMPFPSEMEVERLLALPTPPSSPFISLSRPSVEERLARCLAAPTLSSSPLPIVPHPYGSPNHVGESLTTARPTRGHRADYGFISTLGTETRRQRAEEVGYGIEDVWVDPAEAVEEIVPITLEGINARDRQTGLSQRVDILIEDREFHQETVLLMEQEALVSREAWAQLVGLSSAVNQELQAYKTHTQIQDYYIASQEALTATLVAQVSFLHGQLSAALGQIKALQARDPTHADDPEGTNSCS